MLVVVACSSFPVCVSSCELLFGRVRAVLMLKDRDVVAGMRSWFHNQKTCQYSYGWPTGLQNRGTFAASEAETLTKSGKFIKSIFRFRSAESSADNHSKSTSRVSFPLFSQMSCSAANDAPANSGIKPTHSAARTMNSGHCTFSVLHTLYAHFLLLASGSHYSICWFAASWLLLITAFKYACWCLLSTEAANTTHRYVKLSSGLYNTYQNMQISQLFLWWQTSASQFGVRRNFSRLL